LGAFAASAQAVSIFESTSFSGNAAALADWQAAIGEAPDFTEGFENGYTDGDSLLGSSIGSGPSSVSIAGVLAEIESGSGSIGGSNPIGTFALESSEGSGDRLVLTFTSPVRYFSFYHIDNTDIDLFVDFTIAEITEFDTGATSASGDSAQFFGLVADGADGLIEQVSFSGVGGSQRWAVDNLAWGDTTVVPVPAAAWLFGSALVGAGIFGRRKAQA
jgi:hypothetical protein